VRHGIGCTTPHAAKYRGGERLAQSGCSRWCAARTPWRGINVPIRTVVFTGLAKYDGTRNRMLNAR